eukprot:scaffold12336_cov35-Tisochrysis_lutea.AAC.2
MGSAMGRIKMYSQEIGGRTTGGKASVIREGGRRRHSEGRRGAPIVWAQARQADDSQVVLEVLIHLKYGSLVSTSIAVVWSGENGDHVPFMAPCVALIVGLCAPNKITLRDCASNSGAGRRS